MLAVVTGGGGFLGRYIVEQLLARGDQVRCFARGHYPELRELGAEVIHGDIRDEDAVADVCEGADCVFHTAAVAGIWGPWSDFYAINTLGTQNVIRGCLAHGVSNLVYTSSPSVTFSGGDQCGIDELVDYPTKWLCHYPHSKALAEQHVLSAHGEQGLATCALRPHLIWGPRDTHLVPRLLSRARAGRLRRVGRGQNLVDMVYVENAANAHLQAADCLCLDGPPGGKAYFISQGCPVNCWDWINQLLALDGLPPVQRSVGVGTAKFIGLSLEVLYGLLRRKQEPVMTRFLAAQLATSHYFDISAARSDFGYDPTVTTEEGMRRLQAWLQRDAVQRA